MRLLLLLGFLILFSGGLSANQVTGKLPWPEQSGKAIYLNAEIGAWQSNSELVAHVSRIIIDKFPELKSGMLMYSLKESPLGWHIAYTQQFEGINIYGTDIKVNIEKNRKISFVFYKIINTQSWEKVDVSVFDENKLSEITGPADRRIVENSIYPAENGPVLGWNVEYGNFDGSLHNEAFIRNDYTLIYNTDKNLYYNGVGRDTTAKGTVFNPDPLTSSGVPYGSPYIDNNDSDNQHLTAQRVWKEFPTTFINDTFFLIGPYARIVDVSPPATPPTYSLDGKFDFTRSESGFEDINVMYHIHNFHSWINSLGFGGLGDTSLRVDAHALNNADQSEFNYFNRDLKLLFGQGGIDDAEDADVIIHEYSHSLSFSASPFNVAGSERGALEEAIGDYFACSYSAAISAFNSSRIYNWDGNETWTGRSCLTMKHYPADLSNNRYRDGEIWVGSLMNIWHTIGRASTDKNMLGSMYYYGKYITMNDAAKIYLHVDSVLNNGANSWFIIDEFVNRGLLPISYKTDIPKPERGKSVNIRNYLTKNGLLFIDFDEPQTGEINIYDMLGRNLQKVKIINSSKVNVYMPDQKPGIYLLHIQTEKMYKTIKLQK